MDMDYTVAHLHHVNFQSSTAIHGFPGKEGHKFNTVTTIVCCKHKQGLQQQFTWQNQQSIKKKLLRAYLKYNNRGFCILKEKCIQQLK